MPNRNEHLIIGAAAGAAAALFMEYLKTIEQPGSAIDWNRVAIWTGVGTLAAALPDILEPAFNPRHRGPAHSALTFMAAFWLLQSDWLRHHVDPAMAEVIRAGLMGYLSHLAADATTPMGLPFLGSSSVL
ncbi:MAG: metal-dependent hydrolase [Candidatus Methylacidiphilales bacterium]|nr:metal-dependent hydrolase [Candidatus Methylacidiphilales bacterium]